MGERLPGERYLEAVPGRAGARDRGARLFEELALPLLDELYAFCCRLERDPGRAEDLLQESLLAGFRKFSQLDSPRSFRAWMATIVRRTFQNRYRHDGRMVQVAGEPSTSAWRHEASRGESGPDERLAARRLGGELKEALDELPEPQRLAVFLIDVLGYSYDEAATALEARPGTVASRVARGRASLRSRLHHLARERGWIS